MFASPLYFLYSVLFSLYHSYLLVCFDVKLNQNNAKKKKKKTTTQSSDGVRRRRHRTARVRTDDATPPVTPSPACGSSSRHHPTGLAAPVWDRSGAGASASISAPIETSAAPASAARSPGPPATPRRSERVRHPTEHLGMARGVTSKSLHRRDDSSSAWEEDFSDTDDGREKDFSDGDCTS